MIRLVELGSVPKPNEVPLPLIRVENGTVLVELDDEEGRRFLLSFQPYQALRVTTEDCFDLSEEIATFPDSVVEVLQSEWVEQLRAVLQQTDETAAFMDRARHFLIPGGDDYIEVVAWDVTWKQLERKGEGSRDEP